MTIYKRLGDFIIRYWSKWLKSESLDGIDAEKG